MRSAKSILGLTGVAMWMLAGCASTTPALQPLIGGEHAVGDPAWHHETGVAHIKAGRYGLAVYELRKALRGRPEAIETLNALGIAYDHLGQYAVARGYYDRALALNPKDAQTLNNLGRSAARQGDARAALAWLERAQQLAPDLPEVAVNLAEVRSTVSTAGAMASARVAPSLAPSAPAPAAWIERTDRLQQTLVTTAPSEIVQTLAALNIPPEVINVASVPDFRPPSRPIGNYDQRKGAHEGDPPQPAPPQRSLTPGEEEAKNTEGELSARAARLEISNGAGRRGMAARFRDHLVKEGASVARLTNADHFAHATSAVFYRPGFAQSASAVGQAMPVSVDLIEDDRQRSDVRLRLGGDLLEFDLHLLKQI